MPPSQLLLRSPIGRVRLFAPVTPTANCYAGNHCQLLSPRQLQNPPFLKYLHNAVNTSTRRLLHGRASQRPQISTSTACSRSPPLSFSSSSARVTPGKSAFRSRRFNSTDTSTSEKTQSFSQRMRKLSREYGWAALGIYLLLSALDFPFCFAAVRLLGVERIGHYEHVILETTKKIFDPIWPHKEEGEQDEDAGSGDLAVVAGVDGTPYSDHGVAEAQKRNTGEGASIWTQLALAYAIHKSFVFIRVPLTAAVTPKAVRILRRWGWDIGKRKPKSG